MMMKDFFSIVLHLVNLLLILSLAGIGIYVLCLIIKALKIYIKKNS